jgi:hypothetical protein
MRINGIKGNLDHAIQTRNNLECLRVLLPKELLGGLKSLILDIFILYQMCIKKVIE